MKIIFLVPMICAALILAGGCSRSGPPKTPPPVPVLTTKTVETNVAVLIQPPPVGHVLPVSSVTVRPQIGGVINRIFFKEGQEVRAGDLLFMIDARPAQAAVAAAKGSLERDAAQLANAKIDFERQQQLFTQKLISQDVFDTSKAAMDALTGSVDTDRAAVTNADLNLQYTEIRSPIDGRAGGLQFHEGNVVKSPDDVLLTINQIHPIYAAFAVPERFLPEIRKQMRTHAPVVTASFENMAGEPPAGELTFLDNTVDTLTGTIQLKASFTNADEKLWPGQFVRISLQLDELTNAVVVPSQAVQVGQNGQYVFVVKPDRSVESRAVKTGVASGNVTVISSGLRAGETVVIDGQLRLAPGVMVSDKGK